MQEMNSETSQNPGVHFPPPALFIVAILSGCGLEAVWSIPLSTLVAIPGCVLLGSVALGIGFAVLIWALSMFRRNQTAVYPNQPARLVVAGGPYQFSRNPMYVALTAITLGIALLADNLWMLLLLPVVLFVLTVFVIRREEAYLEKTFGEEYRAYQKRVRRWI